MHGCAMAAPGACQEERHALAVWVLALVTSKARPQHGSARLGMTHVKRIT